MRYSQTTAIVVAAVSSAVPAAPAQEALSEDGFGFFYDSLVPYGDWIQIAGYGPCWRPVTEEDWAPYTDGYWAYTDVGWTWVSHEPFGSIVYHYGRWLLSDRGWCWVPGADWSPAWVSWRTGPDYVGWAPLPPDVPWHPQRGISNWVDVHTEIGPAYYRFCAVRDFSSPALSAVLLRPSRNAVIMVRTENVTQITLRNSTVFCGGPRYDWVTSRTSGRVPLLRVAREENVSHFRSLQPLGGGVQNIVHNNILVLPAPRRVEFNAQVQNFAGPTVNISVSKGWYSNRSENERLKSHINREWDERRTAPTAPPAPATVKDPAGATVRLTPPTAAEKAAVLGEIASTPAPPPGGGVGRPLKGGQLGAVQGESRPPEVPKAQPVQALSVPVPQTSVPKLPNPTGTELPSGAGANRQPVGRSLNDSGTLRAVGVSPGNVAGRPSQSSPPDSRPTGQVLPMDRNERSPLPSIPNAQIATPGPPARSFPSGPSAEVPSRTQPSSRVSGGFGTGSAASGEPLQTRSARESVPGIPQPSSARSGTGFSQQPQPLQSPPQPQGQTFPPQQQQTVRGSGFSPRGEPLQTTPSGGVPRTVGNAMPFQTAPTSRAAQAPVSAPDQSVRFQGAGGQQAPRPTQPAFGTSSLAGTGIPQGPRPSAPPPGAGIVSPASPTPQPATAPPAAGGQKKKPGDPGYVPGSP